MIMKNLRVILALPMATILMAFASFTYAGPQLCAIPALGDVGTFPCLPDTETEFFSVSDTDGTDDDITSFLLDRNAGFSNAVGIYDPFDTTNTLELWSGGIAPGFGSGVVLDWTGSMYSIDGGGTLTLSNAVYESVFGMYIDTGTGTTYYSDSSLNAGGLDHLSTYFTEGEGGASNGFDIVFAWEDLPALGDNDFNDVVYGCIDCTDFGNVTTQDVPEPAPLFLMGLGLLALRSQLKRKGKLGSFQVK